MSYEYTSFEAGEGKLNLISHKTYDFINNKVTGGITDVRINQADHLGPIETGITIEIKEPTLFWIKGNFSVAKSTCSFTKIQLQSDLTDCSEMFYECKNLTEVPEIPEGVVNCDYMFYGCSKITKIPVLPSTIEKANFMFAMCRKIKTCNVIDSLLEANSMFSNCDSLTEVTGTMKSIRDASHMFENCKQLIVVPELPMLEKITKIKYMIVQENPVKKDFVEYLVQPILKCNYTFKNCIRLKSISAIPACIKAMKYTFAGCLSLTDVPDIPEGVVNCTSTFANCASLEKIPKLPDGILVCSNTFERCPITEPPALPDSLTDCSGLFWCCDKLATAPIIPENVNNCKYMFCGCSALLEAPVIPDKVMDCSSMFVDCLLLETIPDKNIELITSPRENLKYSYCYKNCSNIKNPITHEEIPEEWK